MLAPDSRAQVTTGADRYMGSAQGSLSRTNAAIGSMTPNYVTPRGGGSGMIGAANQSFDRTNAAMQSMLTNRAATVRGLGQSAVYRTSDNLYGVYWQMHYARNAQMRSSYFAMMHGRPIWPTAHLDRQAMEDNARRNLQMEARGQQLIRRMDRFNPELPPNPGIFTPDTILNDVPGSDLIRRDLERKAEQDRSQLQPNPRRRRPRPRN
jgi:hypothetical protein